jgi:BlaI family transcriptional regulator, penicillinase repressor
MSKSTPTDAELEVLNVLWTKGPSTVREINEMLSKEKEVGYTTTLKIMQIMTVKGLLERDESSRTHVYKPLMKESDTQRTMMDKLLNSAFGGSASKLVMQALGNNKTTKAELDEIRKFLDNQLENKKGERE